MMTARPFKVPFFFSLAECFTYTFLNESDKARTLRNTSWAWSPLFDLKLDGWYLFGGDAGDQMADSCVPYRHWRAQRPGWLNGSHPTVANGAVNRIVCFSSFSDCCQFSTSITVRNCGGFFVYKLTSATVCVSISIARYCSNGLPSITPGVITQCGNYVCFKVCLKYKY